MWTFQDQEKEDVRTFQNDGGCSLARIYEHCFLVSTAHALFALCTRLLFEWIFHTPHHGVTQSRMSINGIYHRSSTCSAR